MTSKSIFIALAVVAVLSFGMTAMAGSWGHGYGHQGGRMMGYGSSNGYGNGNSLCPAWSAAPGAGLNAATPLVKPSSGITQHMGRGAGGWMPSPSHTR